MLQAIQEERRKQPASLSQRMHTCHASAIGIEEKVWVRVRMNFGRSELLADWMLLGVTVRHAQYGAVITR